MLILCFIAFMSRYVYYRVFPDVLMCACCILIKITYLLTYLLRSCILSHYSFPGWTAIGQWAMSCICNCNANPGF